MVQLFWINTIVRTHVKKKRLGLPNNASSFRLSRSKLIIIEKMRDSKVSKNRILLLIKLKA